jgi:hypothetical protein
MNYVFFSTIAQGHFYYNGKTASKFFEAAFSLCHMCFLSLKSVGHVFDLKQLLGLVT